MATISTRPFDWIDKLQRRLRSPPATNALDSIVFARRQSPDWADLASDYRVGRPVDPRRYVPDHEIPAFPPQVDRLIGLWNTYFKIDFFTCRAFLAELSRRNIVGVQNSRRFAYDEVDAITALTSDTRFLLFFHDDDDFFAPDMHARLAHRRGLGADCCVFPLFRVHTDLLTFVRKGKKSEFVWGRRAPFTCRFHSNNYGLNSRICTPALLRAMKDHLEASSYADRIGLSETVFEFPISATVKTPCSASMLSDLAADPHAFRNAMLEFAERFSAPELPNAYAWLRDPLREVASLFRAVAVGKGYEGIPS